MGRLVLFLGVCTVLAGCARDREADVRALLDGWFFLGETEHFTATRTCTGAVFRVEVPAPRPELDVLDSTAAAQIRFRAEGFAVLQVDGRTPHELVDELLLSPSGDMGRQTLSNASGAADCFGETPYRSTLREALTQQGAYLIYDAGSDSFMVLDDRRYRVFYVSGRHL